MQSSCLNSYGDGCTAFAGTVQELLGHKACPERSRRNVKTTMVGTHVLNRGGFGRSQPLGLTNWWGLTWPRIVLATV